MRFDLGPQDRPKTIFLLVTWDGVPYMAEVWDGDALYANARVEEGQTWLVVGARTDSIRTCMKYVFRENWFSSHLLTQL
jgi:hypothetical protein